MILKLFKTTYIAQIVFLILLTIVLWLPAFIRPIPVVSLQFNQFTSFLFPESYLGLPVLSVFIAFILLLFEAFFLSYLFSVNELTHRNNFLAGFLFILFLSRSPEHLNFQPSQIALLFLILALRNILNNFKSTQSLNLLLTASFWISIASLFVPSVIFIYPALWISLILFQIFSWRSIPISLIGLIIPYFILFTAYVSVNEHLLFIDQIVRQAESLFSMPTMPKTNEIIELALSAILTFFSASYILSRVGKQVIHIRKKTSFIFWLLGISILVSILSTDVSAREIVFIPFAAILGYYFNALKRQFWADLFISLIFFLILFQNYKSLFYA